MATTETNNDSAARSLLALVEVPGALKFAAPYYAYRSIISGNLLTEGEDGTSLAQAGQATQELAVRFEDVVAIEPHPFKNHLLVARTAEGSSISAEPETLLQKLQEHTK